MKCIAAVVMVALAIAAEASYVPSVYHGYGYASAAPVVTYAAHQEPTIVQSNDHQSWAHHAYAHQAPIVAYNSYPHQVPAAVTAYDSHWDHHHQDPAVVVAVPVHYSASYVAANRGAVHKAPLPGHIVNQKSLNLAAAPGTW